MIHSKLLYTESAIIIQKMYKGYYIRKKLKIYYNLPRDLQRKILWHINSGIYLRYYNSSVSKIIYRRYTEFYNNYIDVFNTDSFTEFYIDSDIFTEFYIDLISLVKLSIKYYLIMNIKKIPYFYNVKCLCRCVEKLYYRININDPNLVIIKKYFYLFN